MADDQTAHRLEGGPDEGVARSTPADAGELFDELTDFTEKADSPEARSEIREIRGLLLEANDRGLIGSGVRRLRPGDAAEAFVGSVVFAAPLLVEDGVFEIADYLFGVTVSGVPLFLIANTLFVVLMTYALLEWTGRNKEETHLLLGRIPVRLVMVLAVSFLVAALLMTVWGRVGDWNPPAEAIARINVLWTVGSLGAALGDILSDGDAGGAVPAVAASTADDPARFARGSSERRAAAPGAPSTSAAELTDGDLVAAIHDRFDSLESAVDDHEDRREVRRIKNRTAHATLDGTFGGQIRKYTSRDIAEAFVGSIFFSIPLLVEDGVFDVAEYFLSFRIGQFPVFFLLNATFVLLMVGMLVYWAGPQNVQVSRPIFGVVPRRLVGIGAVSFLTAAALMTMWGRVDDWTDPVHAIARISVVWTVASFGAALGDVLPGESSGSDINDDLSAFVEFAGVADEASEGPE